MTTREYHTVYTCACGHREEITTLYGKPSREEIAAMKRQPCGRCQAERRNKEMEK